MERDRLGGGGPYSPDADEASNQPELFETTEEKPVPKPLPVARATTNVPTRRLALGLIAGHFMKVHAIVAGLGGLKAQLMFPRLGLRQIQGTRLKDATTLPRLGLQLFVKAHGVML